jgi:hypothetical protein
MQSLRAIYQLLSSGGKFVFEIEPLEAMPKPTDSWKGSVKYKNPNTMIILSTLMSTIEQNITLTICRYDFVKKNRIIKTEIEEFKVRYHDPCKIHEMLSAVGFRKINTFKAYDRSKIPEQEDDLIIHECVK